RAILAGVAFTETQFTNLIGALLGQSGIRTTRRMIEVGMERFPKSPFFPHLLAVSYFEGEELRGIAEYNIRMLLDKAEKLANALPHDERRERLLQDIADRRKILEAANPFLSMFGPGGGIPDPFAFFDDFEDDDEFDDG